MTMPSSVMIDTNVTPQEVIQVHSIHNMPVIIYNTSKEGKLS